VPLLLTAVSFALAFAQRPGEIVADTKINLYVSPARFLSQVVSAWTPGTTLGHVFSGQYGGYLFPMAPFFAAGHGAQLPMWVVQRLWLGALLAIGAWGIVRLLDVMHSPRRGIAHLVAGAMFVLNPFVVTDIDRTSISLLAYALLPWMLVAVDQGLRDPRGWRWPALFALFVAGSGGGVNAGVLGWVLVGPLLLLIYERLFGDVRAGAIGPFLIRLVPLGVLASFWWLMGLAVAATHAPNILQFTEQPGAIWNPTSLTESLRLMGYWPSYFGISYTGPLKPFYASAGPLLFSPWVVGASLVVPALALAALPWTMRRRYAPFLLALTLVGLLAMTAGFPNGTPLRRGLLFSYYHFSLLQVLRTTYKAGPLVAVGLACLGGLGASALAVRLRGLRRIGRRRWASGGAVVLGVALLAAASWPLVDGTALDATLSLPHGVPPAWHQVASDLNRDLPAQDRAMVLPGQLFGFYRWGGTVDPILPALTSRPVAERGITPYADLRADNLMWGVDSLVTQQRAYPGQLGPLLNLLGVGAVVVGSDGDLSRSGEMAPADAARVLAEQGLSRPTRSYGPSRAFQSGAGQLAARTVLPQVRRYTLPTAGMVRVLPAAAPTILDGDGGGVIDLAALGALPSDQALRYAADMSTAQIRTAARAGANLAITDSNRRQILATSSLFQNTGPVLGPTDPISKDSAQFDPFPQAGTAAQTVTQLGGGVSYVRTTSSPGYPQFPEHRPFAALDGNPNTEWLVDRHIDASQRDLQVGFPKPRTVPYVNLTPYDDARASVLAVSIDGQRFAIHPGLNHLVLSHPARASQLTVSLDTVTHPRVAAGGGGGIRELAIPGVHATETLRPPVLVQHALAHTNLDRDSLTYVFSRTTGDQPFARQPFDPDPQFGDVAYPGDGETVLARSFSAPAARSWSAQAWVSPAATAPDPALDRLAGYHGTDTFASSSRFQGRPGYRASSAFDARAPAAGWVGEWYSDRGAWLQVSATHRLTIRRLRLTPSAAPVRRPTLIEIRYPGGTTSPLHIGADGTVALPRRLSADRFRIQVLAASFPSFTPPSKRGVRAVGIGRVQGIAGLGPRVAIPRSGPIPGGCQGPSLTVGGRRIRLALDATIAQLDAGSPLRAHSCGPAVALPAGALTLRGQPGPLLVDLLALRSAPPTPVAVAATGGGGAGGGGGVSGGGGVGGGRVITPGHMGNGSVTGVSVAAHGPSWLVLGQSYDPGWQATCDGHSLGAPVPLQGYANGWRLTHGCAHLSFAFAPNHLMVDADIVSGLAALGMLILLTVLAVRRRRKRPPPPAGQLDLPDLTDLPAPGPPRRWSPARALAAGIIAAGVLGFAFALRAGVVLGPLLAYTLWRGVPEGRLTRLAGGLLLVVVPAIYLIFPPGNEGGFDPNYAEVEIYAHFVAVLAVCALGLALVRVLADLRSTRTRGESQR
jgi:arabinofuranan 3-O-arabinosyltransferase